MRSYSGAFLLVATALWGSALFPFADADEHSHTYKKGEDVLVWVNAVGPYENRQETYEFFQLPYCQGNKVHDHYHETLGEALQGMQLVDSGLEVHFLETVKNSVICKDTPLSPKKVSLFRYAVVNNYVFQLFVDDLPVGGFVGKPGSGKKNAQVFTHFNFNFTYNMDRIITADVTMEDPVTLAWEDGEKEQLITFTYSVSWQETNLQFADRFDKYLDSKFFEHQIHWFSIFNSFMMVIFLTGLVVLILMRTLRRDIARYDKEYDLGDLDRELGDDYGWKQVHGDVFRPPPHLSWLAAMIGSGYQLAVVTFVVISLTMISDLYEERSSILTVAIIVYALTAVVSGYFSGAFYSQYGGKRWIRTLVLTAALWPGVVTIVSAMVNFVAISYSSTKAIPFGTMIAVLAIWLLVVLPLTALGTIMGRSISGVAHFPTRVNPIPRPIPEKQWYLESFVVVLLAGLLPFGSIFIEMYFVFTSFWAYKVYYVYGFMLLVLVILWIVTACIAIVASYFLLNAEDHRWHWVSFLSGGSVALYIYAYSIYYFFGRTKMYGLFQTSFYFGYQALACFCIFMICGSIGYLSASIFVKKIYSTVKID